MSLSPVGARNTGSRPTLYRAALRPFDKPQTAVAAHLTSRKPASVPIAAHAQVAELVDALVSGTSAARRGGSSPLLGTMPIPLSPIGEPSMTIRLHRGDLPDLSTIGRRRAPSTPRRWGSIPTATGCASCSSRPATAPPTWSRSRRARRGAEPRGAAGRPRDPQDLSFCPLRSRRAAASAWRSWRAGLLHQDRLAACPHLYRQARPQGSRARSCSGIDLSKQQQSSDWGADDLTEAQVAYAASDVLHLHALKEKLDAMLAREGRDGTGGRLLPLPARPGPARPRRLGGGGHFRPFLGSKIGKAYELGNFFPLFPQSGRFLSPYSWDGAAASGPYLGATMESHEDSIAWGSRLILFRADGARG